MRPIRTPWLALLALGAAACRSSGEHETRPAQPQERPVAAAPAAPAAETTTAAQEPAAAKPATSADAKPATTLAFTGTRAERFAAMGAAYNEAMNTYYQAFRDAKTEEEQRKIAETTTPPDTAPYQAYALALVAEDPSDETGFKALNWMLSQRPEKQELARCIDLLERHHFESERIGESLMMLRYAGPAGRGLLEKLAEKSPHRDVRGRALMSLAEASKDDVSTSASLADMGEEDRRRYTEYLGADEVERLLALDRTKAEQDVLALYERVERDYADVESARGDPLGVSAKNAVYEMKNLVVGKTAPDIEGEDIDGVAFQLSDYRGKVVLLDFWGHW